MGHVKKRVCNCKVDYHVTYAAPYKPEHFKEILTVRHHYSQSTFFVQFCTDLRTFGNVSYGLLVLRLQSVTMAYLDY